MYNFRVLSRDVDRNAQDLQEQEQILQCVKNDLKTLDLKISLYVAACHNYPIVELFPRPPPIFSGTAFIDNVKLQEINDAIPSTENLLDFLKLPVGQVLSSFPYRIIKWLALGLKVPSISYKDPDCYNDILQECIGERETEIEAQLIPEAIFGVKVQHLTMMGRKWEAINRSQQVGQAFLPCSVEELHSLLYRGLIARSSEDDGSVLLYANLKLCVNAAPSSWAWGKSSIGTKLKVVAIVDFITQHAQSETEDENERSRVSRNIRLLDPAFGKFKYLLVYPQERRHQQPLVQEVRVSRHSATLLQRVIAVTWAVALFISCVLPKLQSEQNVKNMLKEVQHLIPDFVHV